MQAIPICLVFVPIAWMMDPSLRFAHLALVAIVGYGLTDKAMIWRS